MDLISVDKSKCSGDGKCVEICPIHILKMNEGQRVPEFVQGGEDVCIRCGHCFAFCPTGAIKLSGVDAKEAMRLDQTKLPSAQQIELFLKGRRSIRAYKDEPVTKEIIEKLLDIASYAPSGINRQPVNWAVLMGKDKVYGLGEQVSLWMEGLLNAKDQMAEAFRFERLVDSWKKGRDLICREAPCIVIAYGIKDDPMVPQSCTISGEYLELAAFGLGLGACWAGYVSMALNMSGEVRKFAGLSSHAYAGAAMMVGYPKYRYSRIPARNIPKIIWK